MWTRAWWAAVWAVFTLACPVDSQELTRGSEKVTFGLSLFTSQRDTVGADSLSVIVCPDAMPWHGRVADVRLILPLGLELVSGDTVCVFQLLPHASPRSVVVKALADGTFDIRGTVSIVSVTGESEVEEVSLPIHVRDGVIRAGLNVVHRREHVRGGRRYRIAGQWEIPMEDGEDFDIVQFAKEGSPPRPIALPRVKCRECRAGSDVAVSFAIVVNKHGRVIQASLESRMPDVLGGIELAAARAALLETRFEPARIGGRAVSDLCHVGIVVSAR